MEDPGDLASPVKMILAEIVAFRPQDLPLLPGKPAGGGKHTNRRKVGGWVAVGQQ